MKTPRLSPDVTVRAITDEDLNAVYQLETRCFSDPWSREIFSYCLSLPGAAFALWREETLLAYAFLSIAADEGEVLNIAVAPEARGAGMGRALLALLHNHGAACGVKTIYLEVREHNTPAIALYRSFGYETTGKRRGYYRNPVEDALLMRLVLK